MQTVTRILVGIGFLIGIYLFLGNYKGAASIINTIATNTNTSIKVLQGRG